MLMETVISPRMILLLLIPFVMSKWLIKVFLSDEKIVTDSFSSEKKYLSYNVLNILYRTDAYKC